MRRARELAAAGFEANLAPLPEPLNRLDFDAYRDIRFRPDRALLGSAGGPFRMQLFHLGFLYQRPVTVNVIRDGVPTPGRLPGAAVRHRSQQDRPAAAGEPRLCRLPPALSAQRPQGLRRADRFPWRELFPLPRPRPALRPLGARPRRQCARRRARGVPVLSRVLGRRAGRRRRAGARLRAPRRPLGGGRLPLRDLPGGRDHDRRHGDAVSAPGHGLGRAGAADVDVLRGRERPPARRLVPARAARFRRPLDAHRRRRVDLAAAAQPRPEMGLGLPRHRIRAASACCSATASSRTIRTSRPSITCARATGSSPPAAGARAGSS